MYEFRTSNSTVPRLPLAAAVALFLIVWPLSSARAEEETSDQSRLAIHGYGEVHYNNPEIGSMDDHAPARADVHRFGLGWTYEFTPSIRMDAEVDYEHAAAELELEYAELDFDLTTTLTARVGSLLMPVGPLNEFHEPPSYYSVERPYVQQYVIPTTWQENGFGVVGRTPNGALGYRGYLVTGLDATGFSALDGIREGRTASSEALAEDLAGVARLEYATTSGFSLAASGYYGGADQGQAGLGNVTVGIAEADARFRRAGFDFRAMFARVFVDAPDSLSITTGVGKTIQGWHAEVAYDLLRRDLSSERRRSLVLFARYEDFDTNEEMPAGISADPAADRTVRCAGIDYMPIEKIALKADYEHWEDGTDDTVDRFSLGAAFEF
jgi:hypothetical protein